jgi:hypothetical protein
MMRHVGRRLLILSVVVGLSLALAPLAAAHTARPLRASGPSVRAIACPESMTAVVTPCCGPIVAQAEIAGCCTAAADCCPVATPPTTQIATVCCPASPVVTSCCTAPTTCEALSIAASPDPSAAGAAVTISGTLTGDAGGTVTLWQELPGATTFSQLAVTTSNATTGAYSFALAKGSITTDRAWYVTGGTAQSNTVDQQVSAHVTIAVTHRADTVSVAGAVSPAQPGQRVLLLRRVGEQWNIVARARLGAGSKYRFRHHFSGSGSVRLRVELPGNSRNVQSFSPSRSTHG